MSIKKTRRYKSTAKRIVKPPAQSVVLSLMALILIVGAPAIVSTIDESYNEDYDIVQGINEGAILDVNFFSSITEGVSKEYSYIINDTDVSVAFVDSDAPEFINYIRIQKIDKSILTGLDSVIIYTDQVLNRGLSSLIGVKSNGDTTIHVKNLIPIFGDDEIQIGYKFDLSSYDKTIMSNADITSVSLLMILHASQNTSTLKEFDIQFVSGTVIPYGEIIIGATGAILILTALFATPYFGLGGITAKPRRK